MMTDWKKRQLQHHLSEIKILINDEDPTLETRPDEWFFYESTYDATVVRYNTDLGLFEYLVILKETGRAYDYQQRKTMYGSEINSVLATKEQIFKHITAVANLKGYKADDKIKPCYTTANTQCWVIGKDNGSASYKYYSNVDFLHKDALYMNNTCIYSNGVWSEKFGEQDQMWEEIINDKELFTMSGTSKDLIEHFKKKYTLKRV